MKKRNDTHKYFKIVILAFIIILALLLSSCSNSIAESGGLASSALVIDEAFVTNLRSYLAGSFTTAEYLDKYSWNIGNIFPTTIGDSQIGSISPVTQGGEKIYFEMLYLADSTDENYSSDNVIITIKNSNTKTILLDFSINEFQEYVDGTYDLKQSENALLTNKEKQGVQILSEWNVSAISDVAVINNEEAYSAVENPSNISFAFYPDGTFTRTTETGGSISQQIFAWEYSVALGEIAMIIIRNEDEKFLDLDSEELSYAESWQLYYADDSTISFLVTAFESDKSTSTQIITATPIN